MADDKPKPKPRKRAAARAGRKPGETALQTAEKHQKIVTMRVRGKAWETIAAEVGLKERACREAWANFREERKPFIEGLDPIDYVVEQVSRYDAQYEQLAEIAESGDNSAAKVGALNGMRQCIQAQLELLQEVGMLPRNLGRLAVEIDIRHVAIQVRMLLQRWLEGEDFERAVDELREILRRDASGRPLQLQR